MSRPRTLSPANFLFTLLLTSFVIATSGITTFQRDRRQFFTTCWGWGASCSMHGGTIYGTSISKPAQRREPSHSFGARDRIHVGIPSIVTSGGWEPGAMGKRAGRRREDLIAILRRAVPGHDLQI